MSSDIPTITPDDIWDLLGFNDEGRANDMKERFPEIAGMPVRSAVELHIDEDRFLSGVGASESPLVAYHRLLPEMLEGLDFFKVRATIFYLCMRLTLAERRITELENE